MDSSVRSWRRAFRSESLGRKELQADALEETAGCSPGGRGPRGAHVARFHPGRADRCAVTSHRSFNPRAPALLTLSAASSAPLRHMSSRAFCPFLNWTLSEYLPVTYLVCRCFFPPDLLPTLSSVFHGAKFPDFPSMDRALGVMPRTLRSPRASGIPALCFPRGFLVPCYVFHLRPLGVDSCVSLRFGSRLGLSGCSGAVCRMSSFLCCGFCTFVRNYSDVSVYASLLGSLVCPSPNDTV